MSQKIKKILLFIHEINKITIYVGHCSFVVHSVGLLCQNPLVIYLNPTQEQEILAKCESTHWSNVDSQKCVITAMVGTVVVAFTILLEWHVLRINSLDAIGPILFLLSLIT